MFFENTNEIPKIIKNVGCAIFVLPENEKIEIKNAAVLNPTTKTTITIEQVREVLGGFLTKQTRDRYVVIRPADKLTEEAENAILKNLEEPKEKLHFVLITDKLSKLLPTILSRSEIYFYKTKEIKFDQITADEKTKSIAKRLLVAKPDELVSLAEELTKKKDGAREYVLNILAVVIEMAYKSYFLTKKSAFLTKIPKFITAYENIAKNGHIKLHLVADLL